LFRRFRNKEISESDLNELISDFEDYIQTITIEEANSLTIKSAEELLSKYGKIGLCTLDSIQFSGL